MKRIRNYRSCITKKQCVAYRKSSLAIQPINGPICEDLSVYEVSKVGNDSMKKDNFVLVKGIVNV